MGKEISTFLSNDEKTKGNNLVFIPKNLSQQTSKDMRQAEINTKRKMPL
jgi:hypothetical protein